MSNHFHFVIETGERLEIGIELKAPCGALPSGVRRPARWREGSMSREDIAEILNLQPRRDGTAKPYQVKQVRAIISRYKLTGEQ
jgi:hypothetical protein